ncbi:hypothetical protein ACLOJK_031013 [Asimina triloba]
MAAVTTLFGKRPQWLIRANQKTQRQKLSNVGLLRQRLVINDGDEVAFSGRRSRHQSSYLVAFPKLNAIENRFCKGSVIDLSPENPTELTAVRLGRTLMPPIGSVLY